MLLGILSDSHGQHARTQRAVDAMLARGVDAVIHCGDIGDGEDGENVLAALASARGDDANPRPVFFVWGNNDLPGWGRPGDRYVRDLDLPLPPESDLPWRLPLDERSASPRPIFLCHGHETVNPAKAVRRKLADVDIDALDPANRPVLFYGHSHVADDREELGVRTINPGALHRARTYTVCTFDCHQNTVEWIEIER